MSDLGKDVLSYIFPSNREGLQYALEKLTPDHFASEVPGDYGDQTQRTFYKMLMAFFERYADVVTGTQLVNVLKRNKIKESQILLYTETYNLYVAREVSQSQFRYAVDGMIDDHNRRLFGNALATSYTIFERGEEVDGSYREGWQDAAEVFQSRVSELQDSINTDITPEGDIRAEGDSILAEYEARESQEYKPGVKFGLETLDEYTAGIQDGEFGIFAAYTNEGKSQLTIQTAWQACVKQQKNVYFATTETVRNTTMRRMLARHSREPQFGLPRGLNVSDIKNGTLSPDEKAAFHDVVKDFTTNDNYASCYIAQMPRNVTMNYLDSSAQRANRHAPIGFVAIDSLQLFKSQRMRQGEREEYNEILRDTKVWANTFDGGRGVPVISPWQMKQEEYKKALGSGHYTLASLSDTSEAEKAPDLIIALLRPKGPESNEGVYQVLKNRDGPILTTVPINLDYRCAYLGESGVDMHALDSTPDVFNFEGLLS